jgi:hypothetical protein
MLRFDCRNGVASERQAHRRIGRIDECDQHVRQLRGIAWLVVAEADSDRPDFAGSCLVVGDLGRAYRQVDADVHGSGASHDGGIAGMGAQVIGNTFVRNDGQGNDREHANFSLRGIPCSGVPALFVGNPTLQSATDALIVVRSDGSSGGSSIP